MTKNVLKYYSSLLKKKYRNKEKKFIVEGLKSVEEGINSKYKCEKIFVSNNFLESSESKNILKKKNIDILKLSDFLKLTDTVNPQGIAAVFEIPEKKNIAEINSDIIIYLDNISDPGNLGTIIRNCDWFGFTTLLISGNSVDVYNPKVVRTTMGSIFHLEIIDDVQTHSLIILKNSGYKIFCADTEGNSINNFKIKEKSIITFSNEAAGPSDELLNISDYKITIPSKGNAESLNVAVAASIILYEISK